VMSVSRQPSENSSMKRFLIIAVTTLLGVFAMAYLFRDPMMEVVMSRMTQDMFVAQDNDDFDPGPLRGSHFPGVQAAYQGRRISHLEEFSGANGTVFIASRSFKWCPYCMRQIIQLQEHKEGFDEAGIGMVAITYDEPAAQQVFIDKFAITIPILSDIDAMSFKTLGILNNDYQADDFQYGIPHPGMIVIDPQGRVAGKLFLEAYSSRVDSAAALTFAKTALGLDSAAGP